jgi:pimeloyl-ACP methyl ester carboxylesterase
VLASAAALLLVVALAFPALMYVLQERLIFFPQPLAERERAAIARQFPSAREVFIESADGKKLHAWHQAGAPLVLYFGGNAEDVSWMLEDAARRVPGAGWLLVSYRGYGGSEGAPSEASIKADALRWYDYAARELKPKEIAVFGRSLGSGAAVFLASQRSISKVVLVTPFDSLVEVAKRHYPFLPVNLMLRHRFDSIGQASAIKAPLLCIAAARDEIIPSAHARKLYDAWGGEKRWVELEGAGHNSTDGAPLFWQSIVAFLGQSG